MAKRVRSLVTKVICLLSIDVTTTQRLVNLMNILHKIIIQITRLSVEEEERKRKSSVALSH